LTFAGGQYLKKHGQLIDLEIAAATEIPLEQVRISLVELSARGEISKCKVASFREESRSRQISTEFRDIFRPQFPAESLQNRTDLFSESLPSVQFAAFNESFQAVDIAW